MIFNDQNFYIWLEKERDEKGLFNTLKKEFGMERLVGRIPPCHERSRNDLYEVVHKAAAFMPEPLKWEFPYIADVFFDVAGKIFPSFDLMAAYHIYAESLLYYEPDFLGYKEHFVHSFKTAYVADVLLQHLSLNLKGIIAEILLECCKSDIGGLKSFCENHNIRPDEIIDTEFVRATMLFTCLFHDIGYLHFVFCQAEEKMRLAYPFYTGDATSASLSGLNSESLRMSLLRYCFSGKNNNKRISYVKFPDYRKTELETALYSNMNVNHSMSGALAILSYLDKLREAATREMLPEHTLAFNLAAEAVLTHDLLLKNQETGELLYNGPEIKLKISERPLGILLMIADHIQSWGRPKIMHPKSSDDMMTIVFKTDKESEEIKIETLGIKALDGVLDDIIKSKPHGTIYFSVDTSIC